MEVELCDIKKSAGKIELKKNDDRSQSVLVSKQDEVGVISLIMSLYNNQFFSKLFIGANTC